MNDDRLTPRNLAVLAGFLMLIPVPWMLSGALIRGETAYAWIGLGLGLCGGLLLWAARGAPWWQVTGSLGALMLIWGAALLGFVVLDGLSIHRVGLGSSRHATEGILTVVVGLALFKLGRALQPAPAPAPTESPLPTPTGPAILHENGRWWALRGEERIGPFQEPEEAEAALTAPASSPPWTSVPEMRLLFDDNGNLVPDLEEWRGHNWLDVDTVDLVPVWYPWEDDEGEELSAGRRALYFRNDLRVMLGLPLVIRGGGSDGSPLPPTITPERVRKAFFSVHHLRVV